MSGFDNINETTSALLVAAYTATANDFALKWDATAGAFAVTLPAPSAALAGREYRLVQTTSTVNAVTVKSAGGNVNGVAGGTGVAQTVSKIGIGTAFCDGTNWFMQLI